MCHVLLINIISLSIVIKVSAVLAIEGSDITESYSSFEGFNKGNMAELKALTENLGIEFPSENNNAQSLSQNNALGSLSPHYCKMAR